MTRALFSARALGNSERVNASGRAAIRSASMTKAWRAGPTKGRRRWSEIGSRHAGHRYFSQAKYDEALKGLSKALEINPKNAVALNYLGISASQKGWSDGAQKALERAAALNPFYADACFNLAVILATNNPPDKENARKWYERAIKLGSESDSAIEQIIGWHGPRESEKAGDFLTRLENERMQIPPSVRK